MIRVGDLEGRRVALWGFGREGRATLRALRRVLPELPVTVVDEGTPSGEVTGVELLTGPEGVAALGGFDVVVKSPGISLYRPEVEALRRQGVTVTSATRLWFAEPRSGRTLCVTGTKGKSTTASLLAHLLRAAGEEVELRGNVGRPLLDEPEREPTVWVVELSSYQVADLDADPDVAVLLNLYPEHLDWHGDVTTYYRDKARLVTGLRRGRAVLNRSDRKTREILGDVEGAVYFNDSAGFHVVDGEIRRGTRSLIPVSELALAGRHNHENACAALAAIELLGHDATAVAPALSGFRGLPHRLYPLGERDGVLYVDDSISTTPQSAMAAIRTFAPRPTTVLLGGYDRGLDYGELARFLVEERVEAVATLPESGRRIAAELCALGAARPEVYEAADLAGAVLWARHRTAPGGVVLLSPAAPSYGAFRNFEERGDSFARAAGF